MANHYRTQTSRATGAVTLWTYTYGGIALERNVIGTITKLPGARKHGWLATCAETAVHFKTKKDAESWLTEAWLTAQAKAD